MNIHHLELFYYVARHGGISEAVRKIPYGIQQPAVSAQILQLEDSLGATLFTRRPFCLTQSGQKLYQFIQPFFQNLESVAEEIRGGASYQIRIGASEVVLRDHLPVLIQKVKQKFPKLKLTLREGYQPQLEIWLLRHELDLAITVLENKPPQGINSLPIMTLPLVLLVGKDSKIRSAAELWGRDKISEPLLSLPTNESVFKHFQQGLARKGIDWFPSIELSSLELIQVYVENGYGIGLSVAVPQGQRSKKVRALPLPDFAPIEFGVLWQGKLNPVLQTFVDEIRAHALAVSGATGALAQNAPCAAPEPPGARA